MSDVRKIVVCFQPALWAAGLTLAVMTTAHADLDRTERAIARHAAKASPPPRRCCSGSWTSRARPKNVAGVRAVGDAFAAELRAIGFRTHWVEYAAGDEAGRAPGRRDSTARAASGCCCSATSTRCWRGEQFRREGTRAYGTGTADMKGGVVVMLQALKALHAAGALEGRRITVMLTGDEEDAGMPLAVSREPMLELARQSDAALSFEAAIDGTATIGRRGINSWTLEVTGETGHSSGIFGAERGSGAVYEAARILAAFQAELGNEKYLTINPSVIVGGTKAALDDYRGTAEGKTNVIAPIADRPRRHPLHQPRTGALGASSACRRSWRGTCRAPARRCASTTRPTRR